MKINFLLITILLVHFTNAQKLTGTWQGEMDGYEFLQLNIVQVGNNLCGYSYDYELRDTKSYCKANFSGGYNKVSNSWYLEGTSFMEQGGGHALMQLKFKIDNENGKIVLDGFCRIKPTLFFDGGEPSSFTLRRTSTKPTVITQTMKECMETFKPVAKPLPKITPLPKNINPNSKKTDSKVSTTKIPTPKKDTSIANKQLPPSVKNPERKDSITPTLKINTLPTTTNGRVDKELKRIIVHDKKIKLNIYDNGTIDGDTISIYYNGRAILKNKGLTAKPLVVEVELDENITLHSIVLFAENLGSIAPNTALVVFTTTDGKRYELYSSATLQQNASIVFEYKPK